MKTTFYSVVTAAVLLAIPALGDAPATGADLMKGVKKISFAGDSLTDGSAWSDWVIETLEANGYPDLVKQDAGVAGDNVPKLKARFTHDVVDLKPDLLVLNIGTNDREPVPEYEASVGEMLKQVRGIGTKVLLVIPPGINDPKKPERDAAVVAYGEALKGLAKTYDCTIVDFHSAFSAGRDAGKILWGPDGVHHKIDGWRTMARCILETLGCKAPLVEQISLDKNALADWYISPSVPWKPATPTPPSTNATPAAVVKPYPPLPEMPADFDPAKAGWHKFDREANMAQTSWWQVSWVARGGIMPMGQEVVKDHPGSAGREAAFSVCTVHSDSDKQAVLHLGGAPGYVAWVNGEIVWECKALHGYHPDADRVTIKLHKGDNRIVVYTNWLFYASLSDS